MHAIRFAQYAILATAAAIIVFYISLTSAGYVFLVRLLGFGQESSLSEQIANEPLIPITIAIAISCILFLEALRVRFRPTVTSSGASDKNSDSFLSP